MMRAYSITAGFLAVAAGLAGCGDAPGPAKPEIVHDIIMTELPKEQNAIAMRFFKLTDRYQEKDTRKIAELERAFMTVPSLLHGDTDATLGTRHDIIAQKEAAERDTDLLLDRVTKHFKQDPHRIPAVCLSLHQMRNYEPVDIGDHMKRFNPGLLQNIYRATTIINVEVSKLNGEFSVTGFSEMEGATQRISNLEKLLQDLSNQIDTAHQDAIPDVKKLNDESYAIRGRTLQLQVMNPACERESQRLGMK